MTEEKEKEEDYPLSPDEVAFLTAIRGTPKDMVPRMVYADWLQEKGDPRGEFIDLQCKMFQWRESGKSINPEFKMVFSKDGPRMEMVEPEYVYWERRALQIWEENKSRFEWYLWYGVFDHLQGVNCGFREVFSLSADTWNTQGETVLSNLRWVPRKVIITERCDLLPVITAASPMITAFRLAKWSLSLPNRRQMFTVEEIWEITSKRVTTPDDIVESWDVYDPWEAVMTLTWPEVEFEFTRSCYEDRPRSEIYNYPLPIVYPLTIIQ